MRNDWRHRRAVAQAEREQVDRDRRALHRLTLHEASHAAVCFALGVPFGRVAVWWDDTFRQRGVVELKDIESADQKNVLVVRCAGPASDLFFYGRDLDPYGNDNGNAISMAHDIARVEGGDWYCIVAHGRARAEELVRRYEAAIRTLAHELLQARELDGQKVEQILEAAGVRRAPMRPAPQARSHVLHAQTQFHFERRDGVTRPSANPDPQRKVAVFERRCDGYIA
jgi:hypothetical protein